MNTVDRQLQKYISGSPQGPTDIANSAVTTTGTIHLVAAPAAGNYLSVDRVWISCDNAHASQLTSILIQDTNATPVVLAEIEIHAGTAVNGIVRLDGKSLTAAKGLDIVTSGGTPTGRAVAYTRTLPV